MAFLPGIFGEKPKVPPFVKVDIDKEQKAALAANQAALPSAQALAEQVNLFNVDQTKALSNRLLPGLLDQSIANTQAMLRGELSPDLLSNVRNEAAATSLGLGLGGSQFQVGLTGGRFLQTAQQLQQMGQQNFMQLQGIAPQPMSPSAMFLSPEQRVQFQYQQNSDQFGRDWLNAQTQAQAGPAGQFFTDLTKSL